MKSYRNDKDNRKYALGFKKAFEFSIIVKISENTIELWINRLHKFNISSSDFSLSLNLVKNR